jgi:Phage tail tube protein
MPTNYFAANLQWVGIATESTYGTPQAAPTTWVPVDSPVWKPNVVQITDGNLRGSMAAEYEDINGLRYDTITFKTYFYLDSCFVFLRGILGIPDVITGASDPYTHKTSLQNGNNGQPASSTVFWTDGAGKTRQMAGSQLSTVKVTIKQDGFAELEVTYVGLPASSITSPTNTPTTQKPMPSWNTTITIGGTAYTKYSEMSMEYKRATEMIPTITGTQSPFAIFAGPLSVSGSFTGVYQGDTDTDLVAFLANTQPAFVLQTSPVGDSVHYLKLQHTKVDYSDVSVSGTNKWMEVKGNLKALGNTTDALSGSFSPVQAVLLTPVATAI